MKYIGALILAAYVAVAWTGFEPFSSSEHQAGPSGKSRRGSGGFLWFGGFRGGK